MFQQDLLKGKRILVTGGGSGLGKAMATRYLELGAEIYICGRRKSVLDESANEMMELHGGSVKGSNYKTILNLDIVDGLLIGGASINIDDFSKIINF